MILINVHANSAFFDTVNLDGEAILSERFSAMGKNIKTSEIQLYRGLIVCEEPNPVMCQFNGKISVESEDFIDLSFKNIALRGSVLRNTNFVIGIVVYVGTDTKAHMSSKLLQRKTSWIINVMHNFIIWMFLAIGVLTLTLAIAGTIFERESKWSNMINSEGKVSERFKLILNMIDCLLFSISRENLGLKSQIAQKSCLTW